MCIRDRLYSGFIDLLRSSSDPFDPNGGSLFDHSLVYNGGGLRTAHRNQNVPCLLTGGGFNGLEHGQHRSAANENTPLANLWLCGASTFPGIGIPPVAASGAMAAHAVLGREKQNSLLRELEL